MLEEATEEGNQAWSHRITTQLKPYTAADISFFCFLFLKISEKCRQMVATISQEHSNSKRMRTLLLVSCSSPARMNSSSIRQTFKKRQVNFISKGEKNDTISIVINNCPNVGEFKTKPIQSKPKKQIQENKSRTNLKIEKLKKLAGMD